MEDTIVVFSSDHGEQFESHGVDGDDYPYEESIRVPLAIRYPRALPRGSDSNVLISQTDIMPTLLRLCGAVVPSTVQGRDFSAAHRAAPGVPGATSGAGHTNGSAGEGMEGFYRATAGVDPLPPYFLRKVQAAWELGLDLWRSGPT